MENIININSSNKNNVGRKGNSTENVENLLKNEKQKNYRRRTKCKVQSIENIYQTENSISRTEGIQKTNEELLILMNNANVLYENVNRQEKLSVCLGLLMRSLHSDCNVSYERMPSVVYLVLTMIFGKLSIETCKRSQSASSTCIIAADRTSALIGRFGSSLFTDRGRSDRMIVGHIIIDGSDKKKQAIVLKIFQFINSVNRQQRGPEPSN